MLEGKETYYKYYEFTIENDEKYRQLILDHYDYDYTELLNSSENGLIGYVKYTGRDEEDTYTRYGIITKQNDNIVFYYLGKGYRTFILNESYDISSVDYNMFSQGGK